MTDSEDDTPESSTANAVSLDIEVTSQVPLEEDELPEETSKVRITAQPHKSKDFLRRYL